MTTTQITEGSFYIFTFKAGLLSKVAHDLRLSVPRFELTLDGPQITMRVPTRGLIVDGAVKRGRIVPTTLSAKDKRDIIANIERDVLNPSIFPEIRFEGEASNTAGPRFTVAGELNLHGRRRPLTISVERRDGKLTARAEIIQTHFGIEPFSAMFGTLKVKDRVEIEVSFPDPT